MKKLNGLKLVKSRGGCGALVAIVAVLGWTTVWGGTDTTWPFVILRSYGSYVANSNFFARVWAAQERHPGLINEIWFCSEDAYRSPEVVAEEAYRENIAAKDICHQFGISFAYQQGITLGHCPDWQAHSGFADDTWAVNAEGVRTLGLFCCTAPETKARFREVAERILAKLQPDSYWPDDDMRLFKENWSRPCLCFCDRCLGIFNSRYGYAFDRTGLLDKLQGKEPSAKVRRDWCQFNGEVLGEYAKIYREAVDKVSPKTRLGIQIALSGNVYDGESWKHIIRAFAGEEGKAGIRPGGLYYSDFGPHEMQSKSIMVAREAARSGALTETAQMCYEAENWPHIGAQKSPGGMMAECALAIASGCDSLALYWGADQNGEDPASYDFWLDTLAKWRPFLLAERNTFLGASLGGIACYHGELHAQTGRWLSHDEGKIGYLADNALPVTVTEASPEALYLDEFAVTTLSSNDLARVFSQAVLTDAAGFAKLAQRFPELKFVKKVKLERLDGERALATVTRTSGYERFKVFGKCENVECAIYPLADDVIALSEMTAFPGAAGTCVVPTEFGGKVVIGQMVSNSGHQRVWPGCRRHAILEALDLAVKGGMSARLLTDGYCVAVRVRKDAQGRTVGVFLFNLGTGETPPLELAIRRGTAKGWMVLRPGQADAAAEVVRSNADEMVVRLPALPAFGCAVVRGR